MSFDFKCPHCNSIMEAEDEWDGLETDCPACGKEIVIQNTKNIIREEAELTVKENSEEKLKEELGEILVTHFKGTGLPGIGCGLILLLWIVGIIVAGLFRHGGAVAVVVIFGGLIGYLISKFLESQRTQTANQNAERELTALCTAYGIDRAELFRFATKEMKIENIPFLAIIDVNLTEQKFKADQRRSDNS